MIKYHTNNNGGSVAEVLPGSESIKGTDDILDIMAESVFNGASGIILYKDSLLPEFFDLKTKIAGEILQKFSNYRMRLAIVGDFSEIRSKSLADFIRESNRQGSICFVSSSEEALSRLRKS